MLRAISFVASLWGATSALGECPAPAMGTVDIYPTATVLPENLLRVYVYYPRAMAISAGVSHIRLLDTQGTPIDGVFLPTREELWSPDRRRLTLLLDPGRVKTGLDASKALGRALQVGQSYTFEVLGTALDASGCPLGAQTSYKFEVGPADVDPLDPSKWSVETPPSGTKEPLRVNLGSPHDHLSLAFRLRVFNAQGTVVPGQIRLGPAEERWEFVPTHPWSAEQYQLAIEESLEDLAGNRPGVPFDRPHGHQPEPWQNKLSFLPSD